MELRTMMPARAIIPIIDVAVNCAPSSAWPGIRWSREGRGAGERALAAPREAQGGRVAGEMMSPGSRGLGRAGCCRLFRVLSSPRPARGRGRIDGPPGDFRACPLKQPDTVD